MSTGGDSASSVPDYKNGKPLKTKDLPGQPCGRMSGNPTFGRVKVTHRGTDLFCNYFTIYLPVTYLSELSILLIESLFYLQEFPSKELQEYL